MGTGIIEIGKAISLADRERHDGGLDRSIIAGPSGDR